MKHFHALIFAVAAMIAGSACAQVKQANERPEDHAALRAILAKGIEALNTRQFDKIAPSLHPNFTILTVDNKKLVGLDAFKSHYAALFEGNEALLEKVETSMTADESTRFLDDDTGVVYGTSNDTYYFKDGEMRKMMTRWSAVTQKERDGWKLVNVHFSANLIDNPVLAATKSFSIKTAIASGLAGLVLGLLIMMFVRRRPAK